MKKNDFLEDLMSRLSNAIPSQLHDAKKDITKNFHAILQKTFSKLELVTREEFDAQTKVLSRTRKKLEELQKEVQELEKRAKKKS